MVLNCGVGEDSWESLGQHGDPISPSWRKSVLNIHWKDWRWSWNSNTLATWCKELVHLKRPWCWARLKMGGEGDDRGWDGWMALPTRWTWVWVNSRSWWWTGRPGMLQSMGLQRVGHDWVTELNWTELNWSEMNWMGLLSSTLSKEDSRIHQLQPASEVGGWGVPANHICSLLGHCCKAGSFLDISESRKNI